MKSLSSLPVRPLEEIGLDRAAKVTTHLKICLSGASLKYHGVMLIA